jgi:hypothetical protein
LSVSRPQTLSLIETISAGYAALNQRLWLLLIPVALDVYLWLGTQLSFAPFFRLMRDMLTEAATLYDLEPQQQEQLITQLQNTDMRGVLAWLNFVPVLMPHLVSQGGTLSGPVLYVGNPTGMVAAALTVNLVALLISGVFLNLVGSSVRGEPLHPRDDARRSLLAVLRIGGYALLLLGAAMAAGIPFFIVLSLVMLLTPVGATVMLIIGYVIVFMVMVYTYFAAAAVVIDGAGPVQALLQSARLVRQHFLATLGLLLVGEVIITGLNIVWGWLAGNPFGLLLAMLGSAYVGSGLVAARLVFYRDRIAHLQPTGNQQPQDDQDDQNHQNHQNQQEG